MLNRPPTVADLDAVWGTNIPGLARLRLCLSPFFNTFAEPLHT